MVLGRNAYPDVVAERMSRIREPHVAPTNALADAIARTYELPARHVPYVDPDQGGIFARVLVLLDNPSTKAEAGTGSGLLSLDNDDATARNCRLAYAEVGIDWKSVVHWNVCPFPTANMKNGASLPAERARGAQWTRRMLALCPEVEIVLPLGAMARDGWKRAAVRRNDLYDFDGRKIPHCSDRGFNAVKGNRDVFYDAIRDLRRLLSD